jgi:hypothetical protein
MNTLTVIGRRWFEKTNGNTYHSVEVYRNGELIGLEPFRYGYGRQYQQTALELMKNAGWEVTEVLWRMEEKGYKVIDSCTNVSAKKYLKGV